MSALLEICSMVIELAFSFLLYLTWRCSYLVNATGARGLRLSIL